MKREALELHERRSELLEVAVRSTFFGVKTADMTREDLLHFIGYMMQKQEDDYELGVRNAEMRRLFDSVGVR